MPRLPIPGSDDGTWGEILNSFLSVSLNSDGSINTNSLIQAGAITTINSIKPSNGSITLTASDVGALTQSVADLRYIQLTSLSQANGVATLDSSGNVPLSQLANVPSPPVTSVNSKTGAVDLTYTDVGAASAGNNSDITSLSGLTTPLSINQGGTGSQTQNFVDLSSNQTIGGIKTFGEISTGGAPTNSSNKLSVQSSAINFNYMSAPPACSAQLANLGAGNVPNGTYVYRVTFVNALGQSVGGGISNSVTVTDNTTNGQIQVTMPISSEPSVTARRLWRSNNGGSSWLAFTMNGNETYNNNTDTIFIDNVASPSDNFGNYNFNIGTDSGQILANSNLMLSTDSAGNAKIRTSLTVSGGRDTDNNGNIAFGVGINTNYKSGIYVADNFNQSSFGAYVASFNSGNATSNNFFGGRNLLSYNVSPVVGEGWVYQAGNATVAGNYGSGNYYSELNTINVNNSGTSYGYNSLNYLEGTGVISEYIAYYSMGQFSTSGSSVGTHYDFYAQEYEAQGTGGTIGTRYGIYLGFDNTGITNAYGIYQTSPTLKNVLAGNTTLGKLDITTGTNASAGTATLSSGTVTVSTTAVTANSIIFLTTQNPGTVANLGEHYIGTITAGTSFVINSTNASDNSTVGWMIVN